MRAILLAFCLWLMPACASSASVEARAHALLVTYAATLESAAALAADPAVPNEVKQALGRAERVATPAAEALAQALATHAALQSAETEKEVRAAQARAEAAFAALGEALESER